MKRPVMLDALELVRSVESSEDAFQTILGELVLIDDELLAGVSQSVGSGRKTKEITNYGILVRDARARIILNRTRRFDPFLAVARFLWLMSGSNLLETIVHYDTGARRFSDDGRTIPGSSFGHRIRGEGKADQLLAVIELLRRDPATRRAVLAVYRKDDCGRDSKDIPCLISLGYRIRNGLLETTHLFRSNNALGLFPHNFFELSLLSEVIATEVGAGLGNITHFALSMHLYEGDYARAEQALGEVRSSAPPMPAMPSDPGPLDEIAVLVALEAELRLSSQRSDEEFASLVEAGSKRLRSDYWRQFYYVLAVHRLRHGAFREEVLNRLTCPWDLWMKMHLDE